ncbi:MAG: DMT family transporter [Acidobacteriota bacterium]
MEKLLIKKSWQWVALFVLALVWGSSFILMKRGLESFSNEQVASIRIFASFLFFSPFFLKNLKLINRKNIKSLLIVGFLGSFIPALLFTKAQTVISSSLAGILNSLTPMFTLIIGWLFYKSTINSRKIIGLLLGLSGAVGLIYKGSDVLGSFNTYSLLIVLATICYGITANEIKSNLKEMDGVKITMLGFLLSGPVAGIHLLFTKFPDTGVDKYLYTNLGYILILALFSSVLALILFNSLIKHAPLLFSVSVTYLIPIFAIMWGVFDGEVITIFNLMWMGVILMGVFLINKAEKKKEYVGLRGFTKKNDTGDE